MSSKCKKMLQKNPSYFLGRMGKIAMKKKNSLPEESESKNIDFY